MRSILTNFPTEDLIFHKQSGDTYKVTALVGNKIINSEDTSIPIEVDDFFERTLPNGSREYYIVTDPGFYRGKGGIPDHYQTKVKMVKRMPLIIDDKDNAIKPKIIFISHSSYDKEYVKAFVDMLFGIGLNEEDIVCSSYAGLGIPLGENIYDWLVEKFQKCDLHVLYFLSENYYDSHACLNEMGAAWAMKQKWDGILLPGFPFSKIDGCIDPRQIAISFDSDIDELNHRLGELKDDIVKDFGLRAVSNTRWEKLRNDLVKQIESIDTLMDLGHAHENKSESIVDLNPGYLGRIFDDFFEDGYHKKTDLNGNVLEEGTYKDGELVDGVIYNVVLIVTKEKPGIDRNDEFEDYEIDEEEAGSLGYIEYCEYKRIIETCDSVRYDELERVDFTCCEYGVFSGPSYLMGRTEFIARVGLKFFYVADKKVKSTSRQTEPEFINYRTLEGLLSKEAPGELERIRTINGKYIKNT